MSDTWKQWEGQIVDGKFPLLGYLGGSKHSAVFLTERRQGELLTKVAIKLIPTTPEIAEQQLSRLQTAAGLSHPHLIPLYEVGRCELGGVPLVYVAMECAEENLAQVLPGRALTPDEARVTLKSVLEALAYLHDKGFVHAHIRPANVMAGGDELKVSSDTLRRAGESLDDTGDLTPYDPPEYGRGVIPLPQTLSPAGDVWSLGMTLVESLTQSLPVMRTDEQQDPVLPPSLQEPFRDIASHCLIRHPRGRWTVAQIAARLEGPASVPLVKTSPEQVRTVAPELRRRVARAAVPPAKRRSYSVPVVVGFVLVLAAIVAGPKLFLRHVGGPQVPAATDEQSPVPAAPQQVAPPSPQQQRPTNTYTSTLAEEERSSKAPVPVPALIHPETIREEETNTVARMPVGAPAHGEVARQVMPEVLQSARNTIRGTVKVTVKVDVDRSGNVEDARLESPGPSKYFARAALKAAQLWKFEPPRAGSQGVLSSWNLQFKFTRGETTVTPMQEMP